MYLQAVFRMNCWRNLNWLDSCNMLSHRPWFTNRKGWVCTKSHATLTYMALTPSALDELAIK